MQRSKLMQMLQLDSDYRNIRSSDAPSTSGTEPNRLQIVCVCVCVSQALPADTLASHRIPRDRQTRIH